MTVCLNGFSDRHHQAPSPCHHPFIGVLSDPEIRFIDLNMKRMQVHCRKSAEGIYGMKQENGNICADVISEVGQHICDYADELATLKFSPRTVDAYVEPLQRDLVPFMRRQGISRTQDVSHEHLTRYRLQLVERKLKAHTIDSYSRAVRRFFGWLEQKGIIFIDPTEDFTMPRPGRNLGHIPTESDVEKLLESIPLRTKSGIRERAITELTYATGARVSEVLSLAVHGLSFGNMTVAIEGKGGKQRTVPVGEHAMYWVQKYLKDARPHFLSGDTDLLFITKGSQRVTNDFYRARLRVFSLKAGLNHIISPHSLRRACATHMLDHGANPADIRMLLGHADMKSLSQYLATSISRLTESHRRTPAGQ
jgi:integrase/recombinase XerD